MLTSYVRKFKNLRCNSIIRVCLYEKQAHFICFVCFSIEIRTLNCFCHTKRLRAGNSYTQSNMQSTQSTQCTEKIRFPEKCSLWSCRIFNKYPLWSVHFLSCENINFVYFLFLLFCVALGEPLNDIATLSRQDMMC